MRAVLAWLAAGLWLGWLGLHLGALLWGGMARVVGWGLLVQIVPVTALLWFVPALLWLLWRRKATVPHALVLLTSGPCLLLALQGFSLYPVAYPLTSLKRARPPVAVRLPTDEAMLVVWGGDEIEHNYHALDPTQRWAYDLVIEPAALGVPELEAYGCYGTEVLAPAPGRVVVAEDGHPEAIPGQFVPNWKYPAGNHVALRLETGTHLVLAHLQPGSVAVSVGQEVQEGQTLGRCGNSGNTSEPHVHLHHQRQDPGRVGLVAEGLPLWFRDLEGRDGEIMPRGGVELDGDEVRFLGERVRHRAR
jgi:hypothetical protein